MDKHIGKELLETILKALVSEPDKVKVTRTVDEMGVLLSVEVADEDAGMIIGKQGKNVGAIRTIMSAIGAKSKSRLNVKLNVPDKRKEAEGDPLDLPKI